MQLSSSLGVFAVTLSSCAQFSAQHGVADPNAQEAPAISAAATTSYLGALPLIFAHRGGKDVLKENTIPAFKRSVAAGVEGIELDVQVTKDGVPVLFHPRNLPEGAPAKTIAELTLAELNQWNETLPEGDRIRPLLEGLNAIPNSVRVIVDLKSLPAKPLVDALVASIPAPQWDRLIFYSTDHSHLDYLDTKAPKARRFEDRETTRARLMTQLLSGRCEFPNAKANYAGIELYRDVEITEKLTLGDGKTAVKAALWTPQTIACTHAQAPNASIVMIGINTPLDYDQAMQLGAYAVYTDAPLSILARRAEIKKACGARQ